MRILSIGEVMIELSASGPGTGTDTGADTGLWRQGVAGDTFNTAWYLAALRPDWQISYATRLGLDAMSDVALAACSAAGIDTARITRDPERSIGLYMIALKDGERSFSYWRNHSAARLMADDPLWLRQSFDSADVIYLSGITLAILSPEARTTLLAELRGRRVVFDPNIRPRLWESRAALRDTVTRAAALAEVVLPSFDDEAAAFGDADPAATARRYDRPEVVVKNGTGPLALWHHGRLLDAPAPAPVTPIDTTGAGDSFNAGYLAARLDGASPIEAVRAGQKLAALVVRQPGALIPRADLAALTSKLG